jgi:hypothetical protein
MRGEGTSGAPRAVDVRDILSVIGLEAWSVNDGDEVGDHFGECKAHVPTDAEVKTDGASASRLVTITGSDFLFHFHGHGAAAN